VSRGPRLLLDGSSIESETDLHSALADLLGFFDGYGRNLDALRDVLADEDLREVKGPVEVLWTHGAKFAKTTRTATSRSGGSLPKLTGRSG
jgi:RNAse (barnase) inhibitor barstar